MLASHAPKLLTVQRLCRTSEKETKGKNKLALLATCKNLWHWWEKNKTSRCDGPAHQQKNVFGSPYKKCTTKQVQREAETTHGRARIRQFMFAVALRTQHKTYPRTCMTCHQIDSVSHWTLRHIVFHKRFSAQRQLMSYLTRFPMNGARVSSQLRVSSPLCCALCVLLHLIAPCVCGSLAYHLAKNDYSFDALQAYCFGINIKL